VHGTSKPGTGLGIYISRAIAEAHGGTLDVASELGAGSTFTLDVPSRR
jgi:signal transduction histidine kinase